MWPSEYRVNIYDSILNSGFRLFDTETENGFVKKYLFRDDLNIILEVCSKGLTYRFFYEPTNEKLNTEWLVVSSAFEEEYQLFKELVKSYI